jgi:hypothetical protein
MVDARSEARESATMAMQSTAVEIIQQNAHGDVAGLQNSPSPSRITLVCAMTI